MTTLRIEKMVKKAKCHIGIHRFHTTHRAREFRTAWSTQECFDCGHQRLRKGFTNSNGEWEIKYFPYKPIKTNPTTSDVIEK